MLSRPVLIAATDLPTRDILPRILFDRIPQIVISTGTSAHELSDKLRDSAYGAVVISPNLLREYALAKYCNGEQILTPVIVIASPRDRSVVYTALQEDAFDVIVTPINPQEAAHVVWCALWHNKLLRLLASRERGSARFQQHMASFPQAGKDQEEFASKLAAYEKLLNALNNSIRLLLNIENDRQVFDMAASVERLTRQRALDRLFALCPEGSSH